MGNLNPLGEPKFNLDKRESGRASHDQLQAIEHSNRMLTEHHELMKQMAAQIDTMLDTFVPILRIYLENIQDVRMKMAEEVQHILHSTRELKPLTSSTNEIGYFCDAVTKLDKVLTPELVTKLRSVIKETP